VAVEPVHIGLLATQFAVEVPAEISAEISAEIPAVGVVEVGVAVMVGVTDAVVVEVAVQVGGAQRVLPGASAGALAPGAGCGREARPSSMGDADLLRDAGRVTWSRSAAVTAEDQA
jgi:hypothetical protein